MPREAPAREFWGEFWGHSTDPQALQERVTCYVLEVPNGPQHRAATPGTGSGASGEDPAPAALLPDAKVKREDAPRFWLEP